MEANTAYYRRRAQEEAACAASASHPNAREAHLELARRYSGLVEAKEPTAAAR